MEAITNIVKRNPIFECNTAKLKEQIREKENNMHSYKSYLPMTYDEFKHLLSANAY